MNVLSPLLSTIQKDRERLKISYLKVIKYLALINFPTFLILIVSSKEILYLLYGSEYEDGSSVLVFLAIAYCLASLSNPVGSLQIATGRTDLGFKWTIFRVVISPIFIFVGALFDIGTVAVLYALLSIILIVPLWYVQLLPMGQIRLLEYLKQFFKPFLFFIGMVLISKLKMFDFQLFESEIVSVLVKTGTVILMYLVFMFVFDYKTIKELSIIKLRLRV
ncbi:oligosaccharide flippase family protein [Geofilum rubicundum]|uniref:Lipopolysaccharide biosynthesis protein WzxC n=1 Tax=Geofilum rubicundum JCM 15548 TaxID=1236989 RepID=A0A0E9LYG4_9BACT|nr:oligosaccharide flippase family protein [Geofilum rubicundum]GAO30612.1 lipopolysaccharide biosynthesis protein WzxC [Geofilum rubicundum JCM 15548]